MLASLRSYFSNAKTVEGNWSVAAAEKGTPGHANNIIEPINTMYGPNSPNHVEYSGLFFAYVSNINAPLTWRMVLIFPTRTIADEWWRDVSTSSYSNIRDSIQRITPQFYSHDPTLFSPWKFWSTPQISDLARKYRDRLIISAQPGGDIYSAFTVIPVQAVVDHLSGGWYSIRSKANASQHWYFSQNQNKITVSSTRRTRFRITAQNVVEGTVMIPADEIVISLACKGFVTVEKDIVSVSKSTDEGQQAAKLKFGDLGQGRILISEDIPGMPLCYAEEGPGGAGWELVL